MNNQETIDKFLDFCKANGMGSLRIVKYNQTLPKISEWLGKPFKDADKDDIIKLCGKIEEMDFEDWTKYTYKSIIKRFYKWLNGDEDYPQSVKWIKTGMKKNSKKLPEDMLVPSEVEKMIDKASNVRDKSFVNTLYYSGCRIAEILGLKIKHVTFDDYSPIIIVNGKTGNRRIRLIDKNGYMKLWLKSHPFKDDPEAYVFISIASNRTNRPIEYHAVVKILRRLSVEANIKKKVNPHNFRHSRATELATKLTEAQMKQMFGWTQSSDMASVYVHLSGRDIDDSLLRVSGLLDKEDQKKDTVVNKLENMLENDKDFRKKMAKLLLDKGVKL